MAWRNGEGRLCSVLLGDGRVKDKDEGDERRYEKPSRETVTSENHFCVNVHSLTQQVQVQIWWVITLIQGLLNPIRQVVLQISLVHLYPPYCSHLHLPLLAFLSTTPLWLQNTKLSHPSWSFDIMIWCRHWVQHALSVVFPKYSMHPRLSVVPSFPWLQVDHRM